MQAPHTTRSRRRQSDMFPMISCYLGSNLTQQAFCHQENLTLPVFGYWLKKYRQHHHQGTGDAQHPGAAFIPIQLSQTATPSSAPGAAACEIVLPNGIVVRFGYPLKPEQLGQFITAIPDSGA